MTKEEKREYDKLYYKRNREKRLTQTKEWHRSHKDVDRRNWEQRFSTRRQPHMDYTDDWEHVEGYDRLLAAGLDPYHMGRQWVCHHRLEEYGFTHKILKKINMYFHRPANELIIMTKSEHSKLHHKIGTQQ